jgi:hypothetical protein
MAEVTQEEEGERGGGRGGSGAGCLDQVVATGHACHGLLNCVCGTAPFAAACVDWHRNREIEILAEPVEAHVHFRKAGAALEDQIGSAMAGQIIEQNGAEVVLLDDLPIEAGLRRRECDRLAKQRDVFIQLDKGIIAVSH